MEKKIGITLASILLCPCITLGQIRETKIVPNDGDFGDAFGRSVSISGYRIIVGAPYHLVGAIPKGAAYVYRFDGTSWIEEALLTASDGEEDDIFGAKVSISGDHAIIGAQGDDDIGESSGSAYIFRFDGVNWVEEAKLLASDHSGRDFFGTSVSIDGSYALVGASRDDNPNWIDSGTSYVFRREGVEWIRDARLLADGNGGRSYFGESVSLAGPYAVIGAYQWSGSGAAFIFVHDGRTWTQVEMLDRPTDYYGSDVSISANTIVVGSPENNPHGSAFVYRLDGTDWVEEGILAPSDGEPNDQFGSAVSVSGDYAIVGAFGGTVPPGVGSAYIFKRIDGSWFEAFKIRATDAKSGDQFGFRVSTSGRYAVVGTGAARAAYVYTGFTDNPCVDFTNLRAQCFTDGTVESRVVLMNNVTHSGETVLFKIDSTAYLAVIVDNGVSSRASISVSGLGPGPHTVSVVDPAGCFEPRVVTCGAALDVADREWELDDKRWNAETVKGEALGTEHSLKLLGNFPNPFNPSTTINYQLGEDALVTLKIYNTLGEEVVTLINELQSPGDKSAIWNGRNMAGSVVASGIYIYRLAVGNVVLSEKMLFMK